MDLTIEGKVHINGLFEKCCIGVDQGRISSIKKISKGDEHLDFGDKLILPAGIDIHVHFRDPGMIHKEDFSTGSLAVYLICLIRFRRLRICRFYLIKLLH